MGDPVPSSKEILFHTIEETLGQDALKTVSPTEVTTPTDSNFESKEAPLCITQNSIPTALKGSGAELVVGFKSEVPRWVPGSIIKWAAWRAGFASQEDADHAANQLQLAAQAWNDANIGVKFEWVSRAEDATFVLCHSGAKGSVLASAFFPNDNDLDYLRVYTMGLKPVYRDSLWRVFLHELGHVLGLRHEFAVVKEGDGAIQLDAPNEMSVMNYRTTLPELQESDVVSTRNFYALKDDDKGNPPKVGLTVVVDYDPR